MSLRAKIADDLKTAQKASEAERLGTLRLLVAQLQNREIEKRGGGNKNELTDEEVIDVVQKEIKKRKEAIELFMKGGRGDLADKEAHELVIIEAYAPAMMRKEDVERAVDALIAEGFSDFNTLMKEAMKRLRGKADGKTVSEIVKSKTSK